MFARELLRQVGDLLGGFVDWQDFKGKEEKGFHCHLLPGLKLRTVPREGKEPL